MGRINDIVIAPSILSADFSNISDALRIIKEGGTGWVHLDVMDGEFVPNITFGPKMVYDLRKITEFILDTHLMIIKPERYIKQFADAGSDYITIHFESTIHVHKALMLIKDSGKKAGISIIPSTPVSAIKEILPFIDLVLVMSVNPGFGGQKLIAETLNKIKMLKEIRTHEGYNYKIEIDGGITRENCKNAVDAGVDIIVAGSTIFNAADPAEEIKHLRNCK